MAWSFIGLYIIKIMLNYMGTWRTQNFSLSVQKYITCLPRSLVKYFSTLQREILYLQTTMQYPLYTLLLPEVYYLGEKYKA